jgi:5-methylcytosine-specific restriction protein A
VPRSSATTLGGYTLTVPLESYDGDPPVERQTVRVRYMGEQSERRDWYIASQRPGTAYPLWEFGRGLQPETGPDTDYVVLLRDPDERFHGRWLDAGGVADLPESVRAAMASADSGWREVTDDEWADVARVLEISSDGEAGVASLESEGVGENQRDELMLLIDAFVAEGRAPTGEAVEELVDEVGRLGAMRGLDEDSMVQVEEVFEKLTGLAAGEAADDEDAVAALWLEFTDDQAKLRAAVDAIRANLDSAEATGFDVVEQGVVTAQEGRLLTTVHVRRERSRKLRNAKIRAAGKRPRCDACSFDFEDAYGERGRGFIECHHTVALADLRPGTETSLDDLALVCANCHRMIHVSKPWLTVEELTALLQDTAG